MQKHKLIISMSLACGLMVAPVLTGKTYAHGELPDSSTLNSIAQGNVPPDPGPKKQLKQIERALRQNMQSAEMLIKTAKEAGATPQELADLEKFSIGFLRTFLTAITPEPGQIPAPPKKGPKPGMKAPGQNPAQPPMPPQAHTPQMNQSQPGQAMRGIPPTKPAQPPMGKPAQPPMPQPGQPPFPGLPPMPPQGIIITAPDGTQWLVTPQSAVPPKQPQAFAQPQPPVEEMVIIEEETPLPKWPTKEQLGKDGVLKYLERRNAQ